MKSSLMEFTAAALGAAFSVAAGLPVAAGGPPATQDLGAGQYRVVFEYQAPAGTRSVHLAGSFNGWSTSATPMEELDGNGRFMIAIQLDKGRYEYKFVLDGEHWETDPQNPVKAGPYDNAVLSVGVPATLDGEHASVRSTPEVNMAARTEHPTEIIALEKLIQGAGTERAMAAAQAWLAEHPMPLVREGSVSFVYGAAGASAVHVGMAGRGSWTAYQMPRLADGMPVFAVSLKRNQIPAGAVYRLDVESGGRATSLVDPYAWTVTSRGGKPVAVVAQADPQRGRIELIRDLVASSGDVRSRDAYVYLPPGYRDDPQRRYPVLYLHDGQNCWDDPTEPFGHGGWQVNIMADRLVAEGKVRPFIAVGVPNTPDRVREYGPGSDILAAGDHAYLRYLIRDVKPLIDGRYRTKPGPADTAIMGSSMGGIVSLQAGLLRPDVFGGVGCLSPALWFQDQEGRDYFDLLAEVGKVPVRMYLDSGTAGPTQDGAPATRRMCQALLEAGWKDGVDLLCFEDSGAEHNERAWRARLYRPLVFLFGP